MRVDWTNVGKDYNGTQEQKDRLLRIAAEIDFAYPTTHQQNCWVPLPKKGEPPLSMAMMPGLGIKEAMRQLPLPNVSHVAVSNGCSPMGFYGIRAHYKKGDVRQADMWLIDDRVSITPVMMKVYEREAVTA